MSPTILPKVRGSANGMTSSRKISNQSVNPLGFSNGWAEFALKKPPPLLPSSLMTSWEATGPPTIVCWPPISVLIVWVRLKLSITPAAVRMIAPITEIGSSSRTVPRVMSTQKLPSRSVRLRMNPRISAIATAMPTAAERKFCTARPAICTT